MGYGGLMAYGLEFPAYRISGSETLRDMSERLGMG